MLVLILLLSLLKPNAQFQIYVKPSPECEACNGTLSNPYSNLSLALASGSSEIILMDGIYNLQGLTLQSRTLSIRSENGPSRTIFEGDGGSGCLNLVSGTFTFDGLTIRNCVKRNSTAGNESINGGNSGAGIWIGSANVNIMNSVISNNSADFSGGGIAMFSGSLFIYNTSINNNSAALGGGVYMRSAYILMSNGTTLENNSAVIIGGGIYLESGSIEVKASKISNNNAQSAINQGYCLSGSIVLSNTSSSDDGYECSGCTVNLQSNLSQRDLCQANLPNPPNPPNPPPPAPTNNSNETYVSPGIGCGSCNGSFSNPFPNLTMALNSASPEIVLMDGTYQLQDVTFPTKNLTVRSLNGAANTILEGVQGSGCLTLVSGYFNFNGLTIRNCVKRNDSSVNVSGSNSGAGIWIDSANVNIYNSIIADNQADFAGGAIAMISGSLFLYNCSIYNNSAVFGGGIYMKNAYILISSSSSLEKNSASSSGGGIYLEKGTIELKNSTKVDANHLSWYSGENQGYCLSGSIIFSSGSSSGDGYECYSCTVQDQNNGAQNNLCSSNPYPSAYSPSLRFVGMTVVVLIVGMLF